MVTAHRRTSTPRPAGSPTATCAGWTVRRGRWWRSATTCPCSTPKGRRRHEVRRVSGGGVHVLRGAGGGQLQVLLERPPCRVRGVREGAAGGALGRTGGGVRRAEVVPPIPRRSLQ